MKVEVWSDFMCPFCYIGDTKLQKAIKNLGLQDDVDIEFKSYELDPTAEEWSGVAFVDIIRSKYSVSVEQAQRNNENIAQHAKEVGLNYRMDMLKPTNSFKAHRLAHFGKSKGKELEIVNALFSAYFEQGKNLSDNTELMEIAKSVGLEEREIQEVLDNDDMFANEVNKDKGQARMYGIQAAPYFVINDKYVVKGAQPLETFEGAINTAWGEINTQKKFEDLSTDDNSGHCSDGSCSIS